MEENKTNTTNTEVNQTKTAKTRAGSGYLKQLFSTARTTAGSTQNPLKNLTTLLVNFIPTEKIDPSELQVRTHFDDNEIKGLSESIREHGVLQPILVVQNGDRYKVIAGERRLRASKLAGMDRIPARIIVSDDKGTHEVALRENLDRVDLHPLEEGEGYLSLLETKAYTSYEAIAKAFHKPKSRITECIGFTRLPDESKQELLRYNLKRRSLLRTLLNTPAEQHAELIQKEVATTNEAELPVLNESPSLEAAAQEEPTVRPKREARPFEFKLDEKGLSVPAFRWKAGEGNEKLQDYAAKLRELLMELEAKI